MWWINSNKYFEQKRWHRWFAWHPVTIRMYYEDGASRTYWWEYVERCRKYDYVVPEGCWYYRETAKRAEVV